MSSETISIILQTRDRLPYTRRCLTTLAQTIGTVEWVIVDNGSGEDTAAFLQRWRSASQTNCTILRNEHDPGGSRARNQGLQAACGTHVLFLDNDVYLEDPRWLELLLEPLRNDGDIVAGTPLLLFPGAPTLVQSAGGGVTRTGRFGLLGRGLPDDGQLSGTHARAWGPTACLLVRSDALRAVGGFDEAFDPVSLCEDVDLCCRLRAQGGRIVLAGDSRLRHYEGTTFQHIEGDNLTCWKRHARVIRNRWRELMELGPVHEDGDLAWRPLIKHYENLEQARVRLATPEEATARDLSFFATTPTIGRRRRQVRVGVAGCGAVALRGALPGLSPSGSSRAGEAAPFLAFDGAADVRITGVADVEGDRAQAAAGRFDVLHSERSIEQLLDRVPMEGLVVCTPPHSHLAGARAAFDRDVSVLVEKPAATTREELEILLDSYRRNADLLCTVNLPWAHHPAVGVLAQAIRGGRLGDVVGVDALFEHSGPEAWSASASWQRNPRSGGIVRDLGPHVVCVVEALLARTVGPLTASRQIGENRASATGLAGEAALAVEVGWDAPHPRFVVDVRGTLARTRLQLVPWKAATGVGGIRLESLRGAPAVELDVSSSPVAGGPYRAFVAGIRDGVPAPTELSAVAAGLGTVLDWAQTRDAAAVEP
jgi:O-antigen biosynthesis protein